MSSIFEILAEQRIAEAIRRGELDGLPGAGKPLRFDDEPLVSPEQRMVIRILKNAGFTPAEVTLRREIAALRKEIDALPQGERRSVSRHRLAWLLLRLGNGA
ncbi:DnaJ family domain-containing protein [Thauera sinica]|uniref:DUF1992 domain-containing protein n=1 Tax=Thauera sinica TaxID=2665146 RepID=A0ABW1AS25_9RHOO|nr:DUF1992 domain-containing protein [Thauera sp. K11]ATE58970.1 hypothetical protein CCZ27_02445 [Thauera sp. K11]